MNPPIIKKVKKIYLTENPLDTNSHLNVFQDVRTYHTSQVHVDFGMYIMKLHWKSFLSKYWWTLFSTQ